MAARGLVNGRDPLRRSGRDGVGTVPTNQAKLILPSLSSYINEKGDDLISHPPKRHIPYIFGVGYSAVARGEGVL